jgi:hypothetical protein
MSTEFIVTVDDKPGSLARLGHALGDARINIEAIQGTVSGGAGVIRFIPDRSADAARALDAAGFEYTMRAVIVVRVLDEPGALGDVALVIAEAGINIDAVYVTTRGHVVLGVDDVPGAAQVAAGMAVIIGEPSGTRGRV